MDLAVVCAVNGWLEVGNRGSPRWSLGSAILDFWKGPVCLAAVRYREHIWWLPWNLADQSDFMEEHKCSITSACILFTDITNCSRMLQVIVEQSRADQMTSQIFSNDIPSSMLGAATTSRHSFSRDLERAWFGKAAVKCFLWLCIMTSNRIWMYFATMYCQRLSATIDLNLSMKRKFLNATSYTTQCWIPSLCR